MFVSDCLDINSEGHLTIGNYDTISLVEKYGTPMYVMDEHTIRKNCKIYKEAFEKYYNGNGMALYASKALNCLEICKIINSESLGLDVVSEGELYTALSAGIPAKNIHFHGNNKTYHELKMAVENNIGRIVVDNMCELELLNHICVKMNKTCDIALRVKPGVNAHTHKSIRTGQIDSKFGFALETGEAFKAVEKVISLDNINLKELHCHIGSQIFDIKPYIVTIDIMLEFINTIKCKTGFLVEELNLGGGFGIKYIDDDIYISIDEFMKKILLYVDKKSKQYNIEAPYLYVEPGRSIVGEAGITLYRVGCVKNIPNIRTYVSVDGGMCDNPRYSLYKSKYSVVVANKAGSKAKQLVTIAGKCCESGDLIQEDVLIQEVKQGDIIAVLSTGAYNYSMSSNYNKIPRAPIIMINNMKPRIVVKRQEIKDLIKNEI